MQAEAFHHALRYLKHSNHNTSRKVSYTILQPSVLFTRPTIQEICWFEIELQPEHLQRLIQMSLTILILPSLELLGHQCNCQWRATTPDSIRGWFIIRCVARKVVGLPDDTDKESTYHELYIKQKRIIEYQARLLRVEGPGKRNATDVFLMENSRANAESKVVCNKSFLHDQRSGWHKHHLSSYWFLIGAAQLKDVESNSSHILYSRVKSNTIIKFC